MRVNPVLEREVRERMRGTRSVVVLTVYLVLLVTIFFLVYAALTGSSSGSSSVAPTEVARLGRSIFEYVLFFMLLLVVFLVPGFTSAAVAGERERQTLIPMQITLLRPHSIATGKITASVAYLLLLMVATTPLLAVAYLIGGVGLDEALRGLAAVLFTGVVLASVTVACSALARRVQTATVLAYGVTVLIIFGTASAYASLGAALEARNPYAPSRPPAAILWLNPFMLTGSVIGGEEVAAEPQGFRGGFNGNVMFDNFGNPIPTEEPVNSPFLLVRKAKAPKVSPSAVPMNGAIAGPVGPDGEVMVFGPNGQLVPQEDPTDEFGPDTRFDGFTGWSILSLVALAALCVWFTSRKLRTPAERER
jgi:ABC-type transport system involved in multi-copper enzyme maturation permease subunit